MRLGAVVLAVLQSDVELFLSPESAVVVLQRLVDAMMRLQYGGEKWFYLTWTKWSSASACWSFSRRGRRDGRPVAVHLTENGRVVAEPMARRADPQALAARHPVGDRAAFAMLAVGGWFVMTELDLMLFVGVALGATGMLVVVVLIGRLWPWPSDLMKEETNVDLECLQGAIESASLECDFDGELWVKSTGSGQVESNGEHFRFSGINTSTTVECVADIDGVSYELQGDMLQAPLTR
jgi:hypothetical protein